MNVNRNSAATLRKWLLSARDSREKAINKAEVAEIRLKNAINKNYELQKEIKEMQNKLNETTSKSPQKSRPTTRAEQSLRTLRLIRNTKHTPYSKWEILIVMGINGEDKPMTADELNVECSSGAMMETLRRMVVAKQLTVTREGCRNFYLMTDAGKQELARIIQGDRK